MTAISLPGYIGLYSEQRMMKSQWKALDNLKEGKLAGNIPCIKSVNVGVISILINHTYVCTLRNVGLLFWQRNTKLRYSTGRKAGVGGNLYINLVCLSVCLFKSNKRQNGRTDRSQIF